MLPQAGAFTSACTNTPRIALDASDRPIVAYRAGNAAFVQRLVGGAWVDLAATPSFDIIFGYYDLALDSTGTPYFVLAVNNAARVLRFDAATTSWVGVGANAGLLPQTNTSGLVGPRLRFDGNGKPIVASLTSIGFGTTFTGAIVFRFDGTAWSNSIGFSLPNSYINNTAEPASAVDASGGVLMSWVNQSSDIGTSNVVQRNTGPSSWSPVGIDLGQVPQYWGHGITVEALALDARLVVIGTETYLTLIVNSAPGSGTSSYKVMLLKKVGA